MSARYLIVNADDFGLSAGVNRGIVEAHKEGVVTSASLMVFQGAADEAAAYSKDQLTLDVGLHIDLGEWAYRDGSWQTVYEVPTDDIEREVAKQLERFYLLLGRPPTHVDSHQHAHLSEPARGAVAKLAAALDIPVRSLTPHIRYVGDFYGQDRYGQPHPEGIAVAYLLQILGRLADGVTELGCHPGYPEQIPSLYARERERELRALTDQRVLESITQNEIVLCSFKELPAVEDSDDDAPG